MHGPKLIFLSLSLGISAVFGRACVRRFRQFNNWDEIDARIDNLIKNEDPDSGPSPVLSYEYRGSNYTSYRKAEQISEINKIGKSIRIYVDPQNPNEFIVANWFATALALAFAMLFFFGSLKEIIEMMWSWYNS